MKHRLLDLLACPKCGAHPLVLSVAATESLPAPAVSATPCVSFCSWRSEPIHSAEVRPCSECYGQEILAGRLACPRCAAQFPIVDGIPRFTGELAAGERATQKSFGFQWLRYVVTDPAENRATLFDRMAVAPADLAGQLCFEAGCGMGRYLSIFGETPGAEVVGLDLSLAVNRAYHENRSHPFVHVIQGDLLRLPLRAASFDHVYSIGVLHHTPSTERAFRSIAKLVKPGGRASIWVYHVWRWPELQGWKALHATAKGAITDTLRRITTRLPLPLLHYLCYAAIPAGWVQRQIMRAPLPLKILLSPLLLVDVSTHEKWQVRLCDTFDWYSPYYQWKHTIPEVAAWFREIGFVDINPNGWPVSVRGRLPAVTGRTSPADPPA